MEDLIVKENLTGKKLTKISAYFKRVGDKEIQFDLSNDNLYEFKEVKYTKDDIIKLVKQFEK